MTVPTNEEELRLDVWTVADWFVQTHAQADELTNELMKLIKSYGDSRELEGRIDEINRANTWVLDSRLNNASEHKWYRYYDDRTTNLKETKRK